MDANILLIEDVPEMAQLVTMYMEKDGMTVSAVQSAEDGLEELKKNIPDLIILDLHLPGRSEERL